MNTSSTSAAACTIHVITTLPGEPWRSHLKTKLELLHPDADVRVGSGSLRDVMVWSKEMEMGVSADLVSTVDAEDDEDLFDDEECFLSEVAAAEDLAELVESECDRIERAWKASSRVKRVRARVAGVAGLLTTALGLFS